MKNIRTIRVQISARPHDFCFYRNIILLLLQTKKGNCQKTGEHLYTKYCLNTSEVHAQGQREKVHLPAPLDLKSVVWAVKIETPLKSAILLFLNILMKVG